MRNLAVFALLAVSLLIAAPIPAQVPNLVGEEFQVNSYTTGSQRDPAVAIDGKGNFVVVWASEGSNDTDTSNYSIQAQRFDASGSPSGGQFQVNSYTTGYQWKPAVAADDQGNFVVVWVSPGSFGTDTSFGSIQGQRFDATGTLVEGQFQVNSYTLGDQYRPAVAADSQGNFVVVWESEGSHGTDTSSYSIQAQLFDADGTPVGKEFQVNSYTTGYQWRPAVAMDDQGNFEVVWASEGSYGPDTSIGSIEGQLYDANGAPVGVQFQVNSYTTSYQTRPSVAADSRGNFVVAWESVGSFGMDTGYSIQAQRYDSSGLPLGNQFQVNSYTTGAQRAGRVAVDDQGNFMVVWTSQGSYGSDDSSSSVQAQRYHDNGVLLGGQFQVNSYTTKGQGASSVAASPMGDFVVTWYSQGSEGTDWDDSSIQARRFDTGVFGDGFESGDTTAWSNAVQ